MHRIVIVGGGFGGVTAALHLSKADLKDCQITLISDKPHLEYYGVLYRLIAGKNRTEAVLPLKMIFEGRPVTIVRDAVASVDTAKKMLKGNTDSYAYDTLILAPGSVPAYFNIPGMEENSVTMKSVDEALALHSAAKERVRLMAKSDGMKRDALGRFIVVGGGPTGVEVASECIMLARETAKEAGIDPGQIEVHLIEAMDRVLPIMEPATSARTLMRLNSMGVHVHLSAAVASADKGAVTLKDGTRMESETIVWTAGVKAHPLPASLAGVTTDRRGRVEVDGQLRAKGLGDVFVLGDCAATPFAGLAQTAVEDGKLAAKVIAAMLTGKPEPTYKPKAPAHAIPVGPYWAAVKFHFIRAYGFIGYVMRRAADVHVYMLVIKWRHIPAAYFGKTDLDRWR